MISSDIVVERMRTAKEARRKEVWEDLIHENVVMHTPRFFKPVTNRDHCIAILEGVLTILPDFSWHRIWHGDQSVMLEFKGHIHGGKTEAHGIDMVTYDDEGRITELTVFLRPTSALEEIAESEDKLVMQMMAAAKAKKAAAE